MGAGAKLLRRRIQELAKQHGSLRAAARVLDVDAGYLSRLQSGEKENPDDALLRKMGLRRVVHYQRIVRKPIELLDIPRFLRGCDA